MVNGVKAIDRTNRTERLQERVEVGTAVSATKNKTKVTTNIFSNSDTVAAANTATGIKGQANAEKIMGKTTKLPTFAKYSDSGKGR
jgi:hypothetical protein